MHKLELLTQAQATCQALCRLLPACCRLKAVSGMVWTVGKYAVFQVTVWKKLLPGVVPQLAPDAPGARPLLVTEYVDDVAGEQLREQGLCYLDLAGNAWLQHLAAEELFVLIQGRPRYKKPVDTAGAAFRADGVRVLFYGLTQPQVLAFSDEELAAHVGMTPLVLSRVLIDLDAQSLLAYEPRRLLVSPVSVARWVAAYATLRKRLNPQRYRWLDPAKAADWRELSLGRTGNWGGEAAARLLLDEEGPPARLTLYSGVDRAKLCNQLGLVPHKHGALEVLTPFGNFASTPHASAACAPPLLVYADLVLSDTDLSRDLARRIAAHYLPDLVPDALLADEAAKEGTAELASEAE